MGCRGRGGKFVREWEEVGYVRKDVGSREKCGRGEGNVGKYGEVLKNVGEVWKNVLECGGGVGSVGKHR